MSEKTSTFYLAKDEPEPLRASKSSKFIPKVMFLAAVARPRFDEDGDCIFDGKLGIWPFTQKVQAQRDSPKPQERRTGDEVDKRHKRRLSTVSFGEGPSFDSTELAGKAPMACLCAARQRNISCSAR